jgi:cell wall-associated NlpC family hydrolase
MIPIVGFRYSEYNTVVDRVLHHWVGTPYCAGSAVRQQGVSCVLLVASVLAELEGRSRRPLDKYPSDVAFHNRRFAVAALRRFLSIYPDHTIVEDGIVEAGDIMVMQPKGAKGPGHAVLVAGRPMVFVHATNRGVVEQDIWQISHTGKIVRVYRMNNRNEWLHNDHR